jgi:phosphatidylglycerophosphatase A
MNRTHLRKKKLPALDRLAYGIATGFGAGFAPVAPGTFGSAEGVVLFIAINALLNNRFALTSRWAMIVFIAINVALFFIGVWASDRACDITGIKDPSIVVIDEVSGQLIALTPLILVPSLEGLLAAFVLFRTFDIFKPYPIRRLEALSGGLGVMADDVLAGVYAAVLVWLGMYWHLI